MENMICYECVLKHLAGALSYGKQIISGHGKGADLDHRIDFLGEITNAEHHLQLIDENLFKIISNYRKELQAKKVQLLPVDLQFIRDLYLKVQLNQERKNYNKNNKFNNYYYEAQSNVDIIYLQVNNYEFFKFSYESIKKYLTNYNKIYVLKTSIDLSEFDVQVVNTEFRQFVTNQILANDFIIMYQNTGFLKNTDGKKIVPTFDMFSKLNIEIQKELRDFTNKGLFISDGIKPQLINKKQMIAVLQQYKGKYYITAYNVFLEKNNIANDNMFNVVVNKPVCCSVKSNLHLKHFVRWDQNGFQSLKNYLNN